MGKFTFNPLTGEFQVPDTALQAAVEELQRAVFQFEITSFASSVTSPREYTGEELSLKLSWTCKYKSQTVTPETVTVTQDGTTIYSGTGSSVTTEVSKLGNTTFKITAGYKGMTATSSRTHSMILPFYIGFATPGSDLNAIKGNLLKEVVTSWNKAFTITNDNASKHLVIALPSGKSVTEIKSSGFDVPITSASTQNLVVGGTGYAYNIYYSANAVGAESHTFNIKAS